MADTVDGWDCTHANLGAPPVAQGAGYTTGTPDIRWIGADWHARPGSVRICQDAGATDDTADVLDVERGAATPGDVPGWFRRARASYDAGKRPGQRKPAVYCSPDSIGAVTKALDAAKIKAYPYLWLARWGVGLGGARAQLQTDPGPWHLIAVQYESGAKFDLDVYRKDWLDMTSETPGPQPVTTPAPGPAEISVRVPELKQGDQGAGVRTLQGLLIARRYHLGVTGAHEDGVDGDFGPLTTEAVRDAQEQHDLDATGVVSAATWLALLEF